jgi:hypothetical protein
VSLRSTPLQIYVFANIPLRLMQRLATQVGLALENQYLVLIFSRKLATTSLLLKCIDLAGKAKY